MGALLDDGPGKNRSGSSGSSSESRPATAAVPPPALQASPAPPPLVPRLDTLPEEYVDPISQELMLDPVLLVETGQSYERATIEAWFQRCKEEGRPCTDPLTRQELRCTTLVPNYSLKSLVASWAERQRIADLPSYSKEVGRVRSLARGPGGAAATASEALAALRLGDCPATGAGSRSGGGRGGTQHAGNPSGRLPAIDELQPQAAPQQPLPQLQPQQLAPASPYGPCPPATAPLPVSGLYPAAQQPLAGSKQQQAEQALSALRAAATQQGGGASRGAAAYHAWTLQQLAGDAEGRGLLWEGNAIPLAIFLLGQLLKQADDALLADAAPALCAMLQRMAARDADVARSICQCGGVHALVSHLTAPQSPLRAAACRALYFVGWQGAAIRAEIVEALAQHAAACNLPNKPLLAFWRFWEQQASSGTAATNGSTSSAASSSLAAGRGEEWDALALLLHMLAEGCSGAARNSSDSAAAAAALRPLDAASTGVPTVLAHAASASEEPAVRFAVHEAALLLGQLPQNRALLLNALLLRAQQAQQAGAGGSDGGSSSSSSGSKLPSSGAGRLAWLLWELCFRSDRAESHPAAVRAVVQHAGGGPLLALLEAALNPEQQPAAGAASVDPSCWLAAGLLACLLYEPPARGDGSAAAAADSARQLLASGSAAGVLAVLLRMLQPAAAAASPQAARAAALAIANLAAFRGAASAHGSGPSSLVRSNEGSGDFRSWLESKLHGGAAARRQEEGQQQQQQQHQVPRQQQQQQPQSPTAQQPTDPRGALLHHGAMPALLALLVSSSGAALAADAACSAAATASPIGTGLTPGSRQQVAAAAASAAEAASAHRATLAAALAAVNNLCADPAAVAALRNAAKGPVGLQQQAVSALNAALGDRALPEQARTYARTLLQTLSGAPSQRYLPVCTVLPPPRPTPAYPNP